MEVTQGISQQEVEQFLYHEAHLLDSGCLTEWLGLLADDVIYRIPPCESVQLSKLTNGSNMVVDGDLVFDIIHDDRAGLEVRIRRLESGRAHVQQPEPVTVRYITNVALLPGIDEGVTVRSNFHVVQMRYERARSHPRDELFGYRIDRIIRREGCLKIDHRTVVLAQPVIDKGLATLL